MRYVYLVAYEICVYVSVCVHAYEYSTRSKLLLLKIIYFDFPIFPIYFPQLLLCLLSTRQPTH